MNSALLAGYCDRISVQPGDTLRFGNIELTLERP